MALLRLLVETIGLSLVGQWDFKTWMRDVLFFRPATAFGWYLQFIAICYIMFYFVQLAVMKRTFGETAVLNEKLFYGLFLLWFLIDSLFLTNPMMPFLRERQMYSFPISVSIARHRKQARPSLPSRHYFWKALLLALFLWQSHSLAR